jgi:predicted O-methyltransferase YrrM
MTAISSTACSILKGAIESTKNNSVINWNDPEWSAVVDTDPEFSKYMNNVRIPHHDNKRCHGYFALLHNIVSNLHPAANVCELGNREGLSTLAILDAIKTSQTFVTVDTIEDLRFLPSEKANKLINNKQLFAMIGDCLNPKMISMVSEITNGKIDLLFCDTIHVYEQIKAEFEKYEHLLVDGAIILVDDIQNANLHLKEGHPDRRTKYKFYEEWEGEKYDLTDLCHNPSGFAAFIYRREK